MAGVTNSGWRPPELVPIVIAAARGASGRGRGAAAGGASIVLTLRMDPQDPYLDEQFPPPVRERPAWAGEARASRKGGVAGGAAATEPVPHDPGRTQRTKYPTIVSL